MSWNERAPGVFHRPGHSGRTLCVVGGMHGDEPAGREVIDHVRSWPDSAWADCPDTVVLVVGHPAALEAGTRTLPGAPDLNRAFGVVPVDGPVGRRASVLARALEDVDILVDLHQTHRPIPTLAVLPDAPGVRDLARRIGVEVAVEGASLVYGPAMLADLVTRRGGLAVTVELGAVDDASCLDRGIAIVRALIDDRPAEGPLVVWRIDSVLRSPGAGLRFKRPLENGSPVRAGEVLASAPSGTLCAPDDGVVFLPREDAPAGAPAALFAKRVS